MSARQATSGFKSPIRRLEGGEFHHGRRQIPFVLLIISFDVLAEFPLVSIPCNVGPGPPRSQAGGDIPRGLRHGLGDGTGASPIELGGLLHVNVVLRHDVEADISALPVLLPKPSAHFVASCTTYPGCFDESPVW